MNVCFETFGCRLNRAEALEREAECIARGWTVVTSHAEADLIVVRGCSVTARAQGDCERLIRHLKKKYPLKKLIVEGCLPKELKTHYSSKANAANAAAKSKAQVPVRTARAYLKVQDGCAGGCTFCIVPQFRGGPSSVPFDDVVSKALRFADAGYNEIVVTGCNLSLYESGGRHLPDLIDALAAIGGPRIRVGSIEPGPCAMETLSAIAGRENICRFLHVAVQSGSQKILAAMRRPYKAADAEKLVRAASELMPNAGIGCDMMTGFPGELEVDFLASKGFLKRLPFSNVHVFPYSERPRTLAAAFPDAVPKELRRERAHILAGVGASKRLAFAKRFLGKIVEIVVEHESKCEGWTGEYLFCKANGTAERKSKVKVAVNRVHSDATLEGRVTTA